MSSDFAIEITLGDSYPDFLDTRRREIPKSALLVGADCSLRSVECISMSIQGKVLVDETHLLWPSLQNPAQNWLQLPAKRTLEVAEFHDGERRLRRAQ